MERVWVAFSLALASALPSAARAEAPIPAPPEHYVLDEPGLLTPQQRDALGSLLIEHDHLTGEQLMVAVLKTAEGVEPAERARQVRQAWGVGLKGQDNGALLAYFAREDEAVIDAGYVLEGKLNEQASRAAVRDFVRPELAARQPYRALGLGSLEILRLLESPLVGSGRAQEVLRAGGWQGSFTPTPPESAATNWLLWLGVGAALMLLVLNSALAAEAHFTSEGWFRPKPWRYVLAALAKPFNKSREPSSFAGGGAHGGW